jgi:hypothetical protein
MDVGRLKSRISEAIISYFSDNVELNGWIVIIDGDLYLLEANYRNKYEESAMIKVVDKHIMFCVRDKILPLGGGQSFMFHKAKIVGSLSVSQRQEIEISPRDLFVEERGGDFIRIDIDPESVRRSREKYEKTFVEPREGWSGDWLDGVVPTTTPNSAQGPDVAGRERERKRCEEHRVDEA